MCGLEKRRITPRLIQFFPHQETLVQKNGLVRDKWQPLLFSWKSYVRNPKKSHKKCLTKYLKSYDIIPSIKSPPQHYTTVLLEDFGPEQCRVVGRLHKQVACSSILIYHDQENSCQRGFQEKSDSFNHGTQLCS